MTISQLIDRLETIKASRGDLNVGMLCKRSEKNIECTFNVSMLTICMDDTDNSTESNTFAALMEEDVRDWLYNRAVIQE